MPTLAETRLAAYLAAEAAILQAQSARSESGRQVQMAELAEVRAQIDKLQAQVAREKAAAAGAGLRYSVADLSGVA